MKYKAPYELRKDRGDIGHDGSRVLYDKDRPRVEIEIERI